MRARLTVGKHLHSTAVYFVFLVSGYLLQFRVNSNHGWRMPFGVDRCAWLCTYPNTGPWSRVLERYEKIRKGHTRTGQRTALRLLNYHRAGGTNQHPIMYVGVCTYTYVHTYVLVDRRVPVEKNKRKQTKTPSSLRCCCCAPC